MCACVVISNKCLNYLTNLRQKNKLSLFFYDPARPKMGCKIILTYSNIRGAEKLNWKLLLTGYLPILPGEPTPQLDFRVPTNCELIKQ